MKSSPTTNAQNPNKSMTSSPQKVTSHLDRPSVIHTLPPSVHTEQLATSERIPTTTWGPFTIVVVILLVFLTCFILNCNKIRRKVDETKMHRLGKTGPFSFENRHKQLQEADLEWNIHPPIVYTQEKISTPESSHSRNSNSSIHSKNSVNSGWSSNNSTIAQSHHYYDMEFLKNQPPSVQLRLTLESASKNSTSTLLKKSSQQLSSSHSEPEACFSK
ncbi:hypothetical protein BD560DRAFT_423398 [Blakeslea trispora]|nr:hypothetical protein BD560DRAFT_423398 [Blakeslea trispora]